MEYITPLKQLKDFFKASRDKWKAKTLRAKEEIKLLKKQVNYHSQKNKAQQVQIKKLQEELKKKNLDRQSPQ